MKKHLSTHPFIAGTLMLSFTNILSRVIGFFYRVYLSRTFGAEQLGILQLVTPVSAIAFALTGAGMQTAISKCVSSAPDQKRSHKFLYYGLLLVLPLSALCSFFVYTYADWISIYFLSETRTAPILRILALSFPLNTAHACINGYFLGKGETFLPSVSQFAEQIMRVGIVYIACSSFQATGDMPSLSFTAWGIFVGELAALSLTVFILLFRKKTPFQPAKHSYSPSKDSIFSSLLRMSIPLNANRLAVNFLMSIESVRIPMMLELYGMSPSAALSTYGILSGMALPVLFFPTSFTGALCSMLLPAVSKAHSQNDKEHVRQITQNAASFVIFAGLFCGMAFFMFSDLIGELLFKEPLAGVYIRTLCLLCPFMYISNIFSSVLQGLGKAMSIFFINVTTLLIRLCFIFFLIPKIGIQGYLIGLLVSHLYSCTIYFLQVRTVTSSQKIQKL